MQSNNVLLGSRWRRNGFQPEQRETRLLRACRCVFVEVEVAPPEPLSCGSNVPVEL